MNREEAIDLLSNLIGMVEDNHNSDYDKALKMGIKALKKEKEREAKELAERDKMLDDYYKQSSFKGKPW